MSEEKANYEIEQWGVIELMGHQTIAGKISKSEMMGIPMLRVDVPACGEIPPFTRMFGAGSIYSVTFVSEEYAIQAANIVRNHPILVYEIARLSEPHDDMDNDEKEHPDFPRDLD